MKYILLCTALFLPYCFSLPIPFMAMDFTEHRSFAKNYINQFYPGMTMPEGITAMQEFFHMPKTGLLDMPLIRMMLEPRCGLPDVTGSNENPWKKHNLTYRINNYTPDMPESKVNESIEKALEVWSDVTPLTFNKTNKPADFEIKFASGDHGDGYPFDGKGKTLAHAFYPDGDEDDIEGDAHFDEDEQWSEFDEGKNLFIVAAHEFGHSLGLTHSNVPGALMRPTYTYVNPANFSLPEDDKQRIQRLYGKKKLDP